MRGAKKDTAITKLLLDNGLLLDKRSFVSLGAEPHLYLKGSDIPAQRERLTRQTASLACGICKNGLIGLGYAEMDHKQGGTVGRCDCLHNLHFVHSTCHRAKHVQVQLKSVPMEAE